MATHSSILAWKIPWTEEPAGQNVFGYEPLNLNEWIKEGHMKIVKSVHRDTIDKATAKKKRKARLERMK